MSIPAYDVARHPASDACLDLFAFCDPQLDMQWKLSTYYLERNSNFLLLRNYLSLMYPFGPRPITSPVYGIISWSPMCRLLRTSDSANFLLEIQATCTSIYNTLTFGMYTQNLELRRMEPATKFCNWIRRSSWECRYSRCVFNCKGWLILFDPSHIWRRWSVVNKLTNLDIFIFRHYCLLHKFNVVRSHRPQVLVFVLQWPPRYTPVTHFQTNF